MAHKAQRSWTMQMAALFPSHFRNKNVIDIGSADLNGSARHLFKSCFYIGVDIWRGPNVDIVWNHDFPFGVPADIYISCECFEHNSRWGMEFEGMLKYAKDMVIMTCAAPPRPIHGTTDTSPADSPHTTDYYMNLTREHLEPLVKGMYWYKFIYNHLHGDLYFIGFKNKPKFKPSLIRYILAEVGYFLFIDRPRDYKNAFLRLIRRAKK